MRDYDLYRSSGVVWVVKYRSLLQWAGYVASMDIT